MLMRLFALIALVLSAIVSLAVGAFESYMWLWLLPVVAIGLLLVQIAVDPTCLTVVEDTTHDVS